MPSLGRALFVGFCNAVVDGLAAGEAFFGAVPMSDGRLALLPAKQNDFAFDLAGEIEQSDVEVFDLDAGGVDFGEGIFNAADRLFAFGFAPRPLHDIQHGAAVEKHAMRQVLKFIVDVGYQLLGVDGLAKQRLQNGQEHVGFIEAKGADGHA